MKTNLDTSYKSLSQREVNEQSDRIGKLNTSIRLVEKDLGIEEQQEQNYNTTNRSYVTQHTLESIQKEQTIGNESILSIQNLMRKHEFILDTEIKRKSNEESEREVVSSHFSILSESRSVEKNKKQKLQSKEK